MKRRSPGEGSISKRSDGRWMGRLQLGYSPEGRRRTKAVYGKTRSEALEKLRRYRRQLEDGVEIQSDERMTVAAYLRDWLAGVRDTVRPTTFVSYELHVRRHLIPHLGHVNLRSLTPADVRRGLAALREKPSAKNRPLSPRSIAYAHGVLRQALSSATRDGLVARNVAALVKPDQVPRHELRPLDPEGARAFLAAARGDPLEALYTVAIALGLRQGEALGLRWSDIDLETRRLTVTHTLYRIPKPLRPADARRGANYRLAEPKTARARRTLVLPQLVVVSLREHRLRQTEQRLSHGGASTDSDLVFTTSVGGPLDARNVTRAFQKLLAEAGLPRIRFHDLRHSAATLMLAQGVDPRTIMATLGHSQIGTTLNIYAHVLPSLQEAAAAQIEQALGPSVSPSVSEGRERDVS